MLPAAERVWAGRSRNDSALDESALLLGCTAVSDGDSYSLTHCLATKLIVTPIAAAVTMATASIVEVRDFLECCKWRGEFAGWVLALIFGVCDTKTTFRVMLECVKQLDQLGTWQLNDTSLGRTSFKTAVSTCWRVTTTCGLEV